MTLTDLEEEAGQATTTTGTIIPVKEVLRMAEKTRRYLCVFDHDGRPLHFGHERRTANRDQRMALFAAERGCTRPGCSIPVAGAEVHHRNTDYRYGGGTDIDNLTWTCDGDHDILEGKDGTTEPEGWYTTTAPAGSPDAGRTLWVPPASVDPKRTPGVNERHHPDRRLTHAMTLVTARREALRLERTHLRPASTTSGPDP